MATYEEVAPIMSTAGITEIQIDNYLANVVVPDPPEPPPDPLKSQCVQVANAYFAGIDASGGIIKVAWNAGITVSQAKQIIKEIEAYKAWKEEPV